ncbi:hypothetical protein TW95_gp0892 [Pandoravirus inopinatum]|uniref:Uncharacterized protein n=1 Tax=Pandoravirus inopinatum TaxID=1605721 RepID=A0A0B5J9R9_9VIRU|nr:hypothetical protein TW95_gp0892 [Pandoravirus inopinatum]AJF97626.1 hypothetical protein [Pandoravirus inopinatum]
MTMYGNHLLNDIPARSLLGCATIAVSLAIAYILAAPAIAVVVALGAASASIDMERAVSRRAGRLPSILQPAPGDPSMAQAPMDYSYYCDDYDVDVDQPRYCHYLDTWTCYGAYPQMCCSSSSPATEFVIVL